MSENVNTLDSTRVESKNGQKEKKYGDNKEMHKEIKQTHRERARKAERQMQEEDKRNWN